MPQTANSLHFYVRQGGYEPGFGLHTILDAESIGVSRTALIPFIVNLLPEPVTLSRWEFQSHLGTVLDEGSIEETGGWAAAYADFTECTFISWASAGPKGRSSMFLHPRPQGAYVYGVSAPAWAIALGGFITKVLELGFRDSEGFPLTAALKNRPSRRRRIRLAP